MLKMGFAVLLLTTATGGAATAQPSPVRPEDGARVEKPAPAVAGPQKCRSGGICNRVIDLLDREIMLDAAADRTAWRSEPFDTAQFNRVGIRFTTQEGSDPVICSLWWQFARDEEFLPGPPSTVQGFIGDDSRLVPQIRPIGFGEVFGLRARAVCQLLSLADFGGEPPPPPPAAVVSDVKVLLRLE